jgi:hypothetical protein
MLPKELTAQVQDEVKRLKEVTDKFLQTYKQICIHRGGPLWQKGEIETVFHYARNEVIPMMEQQGMDSRAVQALCSWAERSLMAS